MRVFFPREVSVSILLFTATACSSSGSRASDAPDGSRGGGKDSGAVHGFSLTWRLVESGNVGIDAGAEVTDPTAVRKLPGLAGSTICVHQHAEIPCVTSRSDGIFVLRGLSARTDYVVTTEKTGYVKTLRAIEMASTDVDNSGSPLVTSKRSSDALPGLGFKPDDTKGAISFFVLETEADGGLVLPRGVKVTLSPKGAEGPFFTTPRNTFDRTATATLGGLGFFFNVEPGDYELTFDDPNVDCAPISIPLAAWGYPAPPHGVKFPVLSGIVTDQMGVLCTQKSVLVWPDAGTSN